MVGVGEDASQDDPFDQVQKMKYNYSRKIRENNNNKVSAQQK